MKHLFAAALALASPAKDPMVVETAAYVQEITLPPSATVGQAVRVRVSGDKPSAAMEMKGLEIKEVQPRVIQIRAIATYRADEAMIEVLGHFEASGSFVPTQAGTYRFWSVEPNGATRSHPVQLRVTTKK